MLPKLFNATAKCVEPNECVTSDIDQYVVIESVVLFSLTGHGAFVLYSMQREGEKNMSF